MLDLPRCTTAVLLLALAASTPSRAQPAEPTPPDAAEPQPATGVVIDWQVLNRFRLFRDEADFHRHVEAARAGSVLASEHMLEQANDGRGWARTLLARLCLDRTGGLVEDCMRDGVRENYLDPADHRVEVQLGGVVPAGASCTWSFATAGDSMPLTATVNCGEPIKFRARYGKPTAAVVDIAAPGEPVRRATATIAVRDVLIAGLGDSIASGDGNPDRPIALSDEGFCFRRFLPIGRAEYFRPGRARFRGDRACGDDGGANRTDWAQLSAGWMNAACHRSLYGYQLRASLALAIESPHAAVTFLPLACTGATINDGLLNGQRSRELDCGGTPCPATTPAQLTQLRTLMTRAQRIQPARSLDLVFLTVGANDIGFSSLIADVIIESRPERALFGRFGIIASVDAAQSALATKLPADFTRLRAALKPLVGNALERVVFVSYANPALSPEGGPCPGGRSGFDIHPAFGVDGERLERAARFVGEKFLPALKGFATCTAAGACASPADGMTFVDGHQAAFAQHGFCATAETDPPFDRDCFLADGKSFTDSLVAGATEPLACGRAASEFRAFAPRARWIRTPNDSYFAAMTFPEGVAPGLQPSDLHDATWGVLSAVYGGAIHPTAEGHAAMADAALTAARNALHLREADTPVIAAPLPPLPPLPGAPR